MALSVDGLSVPLDIDMLWYRSSTGNNVDPQPGGAYIFRPEGLSPLQVRAQSTAAVVTAAQEGPLSVSIVDGPLVTEVHQTWSDWATLVLRCVP